MTVSGAVTAGGTTAMALLDPATGRPRLLLSAKYLTDLRTAATSAVATRYLVGEDARVSVPARSCSAPSAILD